MQMFQVEEKDGVNERLVMETDYSQSFSLVSILIGGVWKIQNVVSKDEPSKGPPCQQSNYQFKAIYRQNGKA